MLKVPSSPGRPSTRAIGRIAIDEAVADQAAFAGLGEDGFDGVDHARVGGRHEEDERHDEDGGVEIVAAVELGEGFALFVPALGHDFFVDLVAGFQPAGVVAGEGTLFGEANAAIERDPVHQLRVDEILFAVAHFPDAFVGLLPVVAEPVEAMANADPEIVGDRGDIFVVEVERVHEFAVDVGLILRDGGVADAHWS